MASVQQPSVPPDLNEVNLRIHGGDPKAYFQNSNGGSYNVGAKSPPEFHKGVPREMSKVPGANGGPLFEDQNKNRVKSPVAPGIGMSHLPSTMITMKTTSSPPTASAISNNGVISNGTIPSGNDGGGKSKSESRTDANASSGNHHVEINVDMTLPPSAEEEGAVQNGLGVNKKGPPNGTICSKEKTMGSPNSSCGSGTGHHHHNHRQQHEYEVEVGHYHQKQEPSSPKFLPSCEKDLEILKNVRKVYVQLTDDNTPCYYKVSDESQECLFETALGDTNGSIWSRYFKQQQKVILVHDRNQRGVLKLEFGRSRTISCCQTLRFAAMTASFKLKPEEPLCIIFKDKECCISCCCCPEATYETVPQLDSIYPFSVFTKGRWKNRAELMVKHSDGTILGFIDKESNSYSLTMGENLKPAMKACLIGFLIAMDVMDRQDAGKFSFYLRPTTILLISLLLLLCAAIGGYMIFHFSSMLFPAKDDEIVCGTFDDAPGSRRNVLHFNNDRTNKLSAAGGGGRGEGEVPPSLSSGLFNSSFHPDGIIGNGSSATGGGSSNSSANSWPL